MKEEVALWQLEITKVVSLDLDSFSPENLHSNQQKCQCKTGSVPSTKIEN